GLPLKSRSVRPILSTMFCSESCLSMSACSGLNGPTARRINLTGDAVVSRLSPNSFTMHRNHASVSPIESIIIARYGS
ncbi:hypothetical protein PFISCL1PPCAC_23451, partial [Pristionchus fissidentatus]